MTGAEAEVRVFDIHEEVLVVVEGVDAADAFARGLGGEGTPLWNYKLQTPLLLLYFEHYEKSFPGNVSEWISSFFVQQTSWQHADTHGLADRFYKLLGHKEYVHNAVDLLIYATLPGEHEASQSVDYYYGRQDPNLADAATKALAILRLRDLPRGVAGAIELLRPVSGEQWRRFLFFGYRRVS